MTHSGVVSALVLALWAGSAEVFTQVSPQVPPIFRAGVDLVVVDVVVVDKDGAPVTDLTAADFKITAGKRPRRIVSSEFVAAKRGGTVVAPELPPDLPAPTSNRSTTAATGRSILFVVDVDEIRAGEGRSAMRAITNYVNGLDAIDRVGLVALPYGTPRVDLTTNRQLIQDAAGLIVGASRRMNEGEMTPGEAASIALGDTGALMAWMDRIAGLKSLSTASGITGRCELVDPLSPPNRPIEEPQVAPPGCKEKAQRTLDVYRRHSSNILDSMRAMALAMAPLDGQKAIVLVSEGIYNDLDMRDDLRRFASAAEQARVALYALHLDAPLMEAAALGGPSAASRLLDDRLGMDGMAEMTHAARGTAQRVIASAAGALKRIDTELSGYYLIAFERSADDRDGQHVRIDVNVNRPGLDVRARSEFTPVPLKAAAAKASKTPTDPRAAMGTLLQWPAALAEVVIDVDTFPMPVDATSPEVRVTIAAELANDGRPVDVGFEVKDAKGKVVADSFDPKAELLRLPDGRGLYAVSVSVSPGRHTLSLGVIDADGKRGSIQHAFEAKTWPPGPLRMSAVLLGEISNGAFRPSARIGASRDTVVVRVEVHAPSPGAFQSDAVRIEFTPAGADAAALVTQGRLAGAADSTRRAATTTVSIRDLPSGDYIIRVTLETPDEKVLAQASRLFRKE